MLARLPPSWLAFGAIALWTSVAALAVSLKSLPPFLLVGAPMLIAGIAATPTWRLWRVPAVTVLFAIGQGKPTWIVTAAGVLIIAGAAPGYSSMR